jgi:AcrR family transcriptional regulator
MQRMAKQPASTHSRTYDSTRRARQAAQTRGEVLAAAVELFNANGWAGTTLAAIAEKAGVAVETIYSGFGSKKGLLRAAIDVGVVGDAEPAPFIERDEFTRMGQGTRAQRLASATSVVADIHERSAGAWHALLAAASSDAEVEGWRVELEQGRRVEVARGLASIFDRELAQSVVDGCWVVLSPEVYTKLTVDANWSRAEYERWIGETIIKLTRA